jgi:abequosyltransferase
MESMVTDRSGGEGGVRLSICIPTLNRGRFIGATLESIVSQATAEVEIVVVDGGSTDETAAVIESFQARLPRLRYFPASEPGPGPSLGGFDRDCNRAVELAAGEYCWLFTDDDLLRPGALSAVLDRLDGVLSLVVVNAEVRNLDLSRVIEDNRLGLDVDRVYAAGEDERLFAETGRYLSFVGAVVVRRDLWLGRDRARHSGLGFVHVGVLFQQPLPGGALAIARPLISIRYGNASWADRSFPIWMLDWPGVVWSLPGISDAAKARVCRKEPVTSLSSLLNARAIGTYSLQAYRTWLAPRLPPGPQRWAAQLIALLPGRLINPLALIYYGMFVDRPGVALANLRASRFFIGERIERLLPGRRRTSNWRS